MTKPRPGHHDVEIGARVRLRRKALGVTQAQLAQGLDLTFQQVQKYERGVNRISATALVKIANRLGCSVQDLLGQEAGAAPEPVAASTMVTPGAVEWLEVYGRIGSSRARAALLALARVLASETPVEAEAA
ncbi:MAG TPA: helix-turn-helix transcriptional regulator [Caulobacteraceae bacterium]|nr:helix-turn-helix transcriptional regulator [Caulobacteraceae bacterium]